MQLHVNPQNSLFRRVEDTIANRMLTQTVILKYFTKQLIIRKADIAILWAHLKDLLRIRKSQVH